MKDDFCSRTWHWLQRSPSHALPEPALAAHVTTCPSCRGALAALLAGLLDLPLPANPSCENCVADLPAYAELERDQGDRVAAQRYPAVWWHLWTCPDCADLAADLALLLAAEAEGVIEAPPQLSDRPVLTNSWPLPRLRLTRAFLHAIVAPQQLLGSTWNGNAESLLLADELLPGYRLVLHVQPEPAECWALEVTLEPPLAGVLVVRFAAMEFRTPLVEGRTARLSGIPTALLFDRTGPDLQLMIEREVGQAGEQIP